MPKPDKLPRPDKQIDLPQAAIDQIPVEHVPAPLEQNFFPPPLPDNFNVIVDTLASSGIAGTGGADVFVFDLDIYPSSRIIDGYIIGFDST